jgi:hypothetical protein
MTLILSGTDGLSDVDGSAATPAIRGTDANTGIFFPAADTIAFSEGGAEIARFDASGNMGLGVTPSTWSGVSGKALDFGAGSVFSTTTGAGQTRVISNAYYNSAWKYKAAAGAAMYVCDSGNIQHTWSVAASGSADANISFTQAMTLDASGNLGVGTTSPSANSPVHINKATAADCYFRSSNSLATSVYGTSAAGESYVYNSAAYPITFSTNATERARITSGGDLLVGTTSSTRYQNARAVVISIPGNGDIAVNHSTANGDGDLFMGFGYNGSQIGSITQSGTTAVLYNVMSDYRLKTVTGAVTGQGARIDALKPIDYQWKESNEQAHGFLAHEFQEVYPSSVAGNKDAIDKDGKPAYQLMQAATSEVIADLVAEIQSLRKRLAALETK